MTKRVLLIRDVPESAAAAGHRLRHAAITTHLESLGLQVHSVSISNPGDSRFKRALRVLFWRPPAGFEQIWFSGLGAPHLLWIASKLARDHNVVFDSCDSWLLQRLARRGSAGLGSRAAIELGILLMRRRSQIAAFTYISKRDIAADAPLLKGKVTAHLRQAADPALRNLPAVNYPLTRIVLPGDFSSFHNLELLDQIIDALITVSDEIPGLVVETFGPHPPPPRSDFRSLPHRGWAESPVEIYDGDTGVVVASRSGSGIPLKLIEAAAARRPALVHHSLEDDGVTDGVVVFTFHDESDLKSALRSMIAGPRERRE